MQNNCNRPDVAYAGFWVRLAAYCIDSVIVFAGLLVVRLFLSGITAVVEGTAFGGNVLFHYTLKDIILYVFHVLYFILCTYLTGTTLGKRAMNLRVVSADWGQRLSLLDVVYRETVGRVLCSLSIGIGYIIVGFDGEKRGIHDMLCDTRVIYAKKIKVFPVYQMPKGYPGPQGYGAAPGQMPPMGGPTPAPGSPVPGNPVPGQMPPTAGPKPAQEETKNNLPEDK